MRSNRDVVVALKVSFQKYAQIGVVLVNLKETSVGTMRVRCGVFITRLNDRDWWTFGSQEEVDRYIASCRIQNVESVKSMTELKALMRKKEEAEKIVEEQTKKRKSSDEAHNLKRALCLVIGNNINIDKTGEQISYL
jgi:hypothetical protein